ncbi:hypothetical protein [Alicyclobacillus dauci]|uniref:Uncharacterized protein n=1 Tax=Alicyclobacillus dauci TaxID=1475485 RepID=A0ABY6Z2Z6_9BACL|nr:hypothetical protein [Alicyclobacillus dauci]WAH37217.1 hypothetical protein NZD86_01310 [Alicyclobacillus dauci]
MVRRTFPFFLSVALGCFVITGCSRQLSVEDFLSQLKAKDYTPLSYGIMDTHPLQRREGVAVCKDRNGKELIVVLTPQGKVQTTDLGGRYVTYEEMKRIVTKLGLPAESLHADISTDRARLYWQDQDKYFDLTGNQISPVH